MPRPNHITVRITDEQALALLSLTRRLGISRSEAARLALAQFITNEESKDSHKRKAVR